ncbi:MAG: zinc ribbon domain-containing protein [Acidobacteriia bacterium]|nr:zinc ribbon domain-containing protein [Terriglobia bacterium]
MPIYEYICKGCRHEFEYLLLSSSRPPRCPVCESEELERLISTCAVRSESTSQANLQAAHRKAAAGRQARARDEHQHLHGHFEDHPTGKSRPHLDQSTNETENPTK